MLQPSLDYVVLGTWFDTSHHENLFGRIPGPLHAVKASKSQPDDPSMLLKCHVASPWNDRIVWEPPLILPPLVEDNRLMLIEKGQLDCDLIYSTMLVSGEALLVFEWVGLHIYLVICNLIALSLLGIWLELHENNSERKV